MDNDKLIKEMEANAKKQLDVLAKSDAEAKAKVEALEGKIAKDIKDAEYAANKVLIDLEERLKKEIEEIENNSENGKSNKK